MSDAEQAWISATLRTLEEELRADLEDSALSAEDMRIRWTGRAQGRLKVAFESMMRQAASPEEKRLVGQRFNEFKRSVEQALEQRQGGTQHADSSAAKQEPRPIDFSLPGTAQALGAEHPLTTTTDEIVAVFQRMGYSVGIGPEVETDFNNFESLNFPPNHPARDTQDTLVLVDQERKPLRERLLMRTHTSPVQIRTMLAEAPPLRLVIPGKVYRNEAEDATHLARFQQVEGLCVDTGITFSDLKGTLDHAMKALFGSAVKTRFFPSFFPFTEPSADMQISCIFCAQKGCRKCKQSGWIELLGCGMVDPAVFAAVNSRRVELGAEPVYDPENISGFAFGMGVERIAMMRYAVSSVGQFYSPDMRFLEQFCGVSSR